VALRFSTHAKERMQERGISEEDVQGVVEFADVTYPDGKGNRSFVRDLGDATVRVVIAGDDPEFVITVIRVGK
jgi:acylphosphatase